MNPDYTSDVKLIERFMFEHSIYLLSMFEKKIDSFNSSMSSSSRQARIKDKQSNLDPGVIIDPDNFFQDPIKNLSRDMTKPIWNCVMKVDPRIIYNKESVMEPIESINNLNRLFNSFFSRYKNEHEDQSNLNVKLQSYDFQKQIASLIRSKEQEGEQGSIIRQTLEELLRIMLGATNKEIYFLEELNDFERIQEEFGETKTVCLATKQIIESYFECTDENFNNELQAFVKIMVTNLNDVLSCKAGSLAICLLPKLMFLPALIHPALIAFHSLIKIQINEIIKKQERNKRNLISSVMNPINQMGEEDKKEESFVYGDIRNENCSRYVFINLDGFESDFNVDVAKYLSKYLMYVSFPRESSNKKSGNSLQKLQNLRSERLLRKYFYGGLTPEQKQRLLSSFKSSERDLKKNLYMFPIHSRALSQKYDFQSIENYESAFISFIMKEIIYNQILQFNPSIIFVSYSQKMNIDNESFVDLMKELTVFGNYKVVFYANLSKNYMFEQFVPEEMSEGNNLMENEKKYFDTYESTIKIVDDSGRIAEDLFEKLAIMIKISSGTYNLAKTLETDSYVEKYKNYKVMKYAGPLLNRLGTEYPNISKMKMRLNDYTTVAKVLDNYFNNKSETFDRLFSKVITKFHHNIIKEAETAIFSQGQEIVGAEMIELRKKIDKKYDHIEKQEAWESLRFQYYLEVGTQKTEARYFAYIPRYKDNNKLRLARKSTENLLSLEFEVALEKQKVPVEFSSYTKVYYSSSRNYPNALIYVVNHLLKNSSVNYKSFVGVITEAFDQKVEPKVQLRPISFIGGPQLTNCQTYTEFNYFETHDYIFMFWPKIFNCKLELMHRLYGTKYLPVTTLLFFRAFRSDPEIFTNMKIGNETYYDIIPRNGCKCYEVGNTNTIYIMGGFYADEKNYLQFQTDITKLMYRPSLNKEENPEIFIENVPKSFYLNFIEQQANREVKVVTHLKNDMIRPKVEYEILEVGDSNEQKTVFLVGGVGQNFVRPCSMLGHMAHKIKFNTVNGNLESIKRINTHGLVPVNISTPVKVRSPIEMNIVTNAQNRNIYLTEGNAGSNSYVIYHNNIIYDSVEQRFKYQVEYEFAELERKNYRDEISFLKRVIAETQNKFGLTAKSYRGKDFNTNFITIVTDNDKKYILELQLQLSLEVKHVHPQLPNFVRLTGASILAIDINGPAVYALLRHPIYTLDQCILAHFDVNQLSGKLREGKIAEIQLKQIHKFDENVSQNIIIAANAATVAILHGKRFDEEVEVPEMLLRKTRKNQIKTFEVRPSEELDKKNISAINLSGGISTSLFLNQNNGIILCFSFKTIDRNPKSESVYTVIQKLDMNGDKFNWEVVMERSFEIVIKVQQNSKKKEPLKLLQIIEHRKQSSNPNKCLYELIAIYRDECFQGILNPEGPPLVEFNPLEKSVNEYFKQLCKDTNKQHSILLDKHSYLYSQLKNGHEIEMS